MNNKHSSTPFLPFSEDAYFSLDKRWCFIKINKQAEKLLKVKRTMILGKSVGELFPESKDTTFAKNSYKAMQTQKSIHFKAYYPPLALWTDVRMFPFKDGLDIYFRDITARKEIIDQLKKQALLIQNISDSIISIDTHFKISSFNKSAEKMYGWKEKDVLGKDCTKILSPVKKDFERQLLIKNKKWEGDVIHKKKNGKTLLVHSTVSALQNALGQAIGYVSINKNVTKQKEIEEKLRLQSNILENITESIICFDLRGKIIFWSEGAEATYGYKPQEVIGKHISIFYPPNEPEDFEKIKEIVIQKNEYINQIRRKTKYGDIIWIETKRNLLKDRSGNIIGIIGVSRNITERKETEEKLRYHARVIDYVSDAVISSDRQYRIITWNKTAEKIYGWKEKDVLGKTIPEVLQTIYSTYNREKAAQEAEVRGYFKIEVLHKKKDESFINVLATISPMKSPSGEINGYVSVNRDITEQKKIEERRRENDELFRRLVDSNIIGICIADIHGHIFEANDIYISMLGYTREEFFRKQINWHDLTPRDQLYKDEKAGKQLLEKGYTEPWEKEYIKKDGSRIAVLIGGARIDRETTKSIAFVLDISERKELERRKDDFIAMTSHELKTPLTSLGVYLHILYVHLKTIHNKKGLAAIQKITEQKEKLEKLVISLLDISKIQSGQLLAEKKTFSLNKLIVTITEIMQQSTQTHSINVNIPTKKIYIYADRDRTAQVLINLISNAIKYSPQGKKVVVSLTETGKNVQICIRDFGIGIEKEEVDKIFTRFYRAGKEHEKTYPGLGIGLYLASQIIRRQGGEIWVNSTKGEGSTFCFSLPKSKTS